MAFLSDFMQNCFMNKDMFYSDLMVFTLFYSRAKAENIKQF